VRARHRGVADWLTRTPPSRIGQKREEAERALHRFGDTFAVAGEDAGTEAPDPVRPESEHRRGGRRERARARPPPALARAERVDDIRHERRILNGGPVAADRLLSNLRFRAEMRGADVRGRIYAHVAGADVVRAGVASSAWWRTTCACRRAPRPCSRTAG
jgi:uncharacterized circularly permuted ATP-grasp superfamily protein